LAYTLSHGDQRKLEVGVLMAMRPKVYLFDEPTAGMNAREAPVILDLIAQIKQDPRACVLLVEHKMDVVRALADRVMVMHNGERIADGLPAEVMALQVVREAYLGQALEHAEART
jgi:branched-chain amino acid transport system ATP-binding protein